MAAPNVSGKVCTKHPNTPATSRCLTCFKPLCEKCVVDRQGLDFCSEACAGKHFASSKNLAEFNAREAAHKRKALIKKLITLVVLLVLALGFAFAYTRNIGGLKDQAQKLIELIQSKKK